MKKLKALTEEIGADLKKRREPPPAATVLMSNWGAWRVTPAVLASKTCSNSPA